MALRPKTILVLLVVIREACSLHQRTSGCIHNHTQSQSLPVTDCACMADTLAWCPFHHLSAKDPWLYQVQFTLKPTRYTGGAGATWVPAHPCHHMSAGNWLGPATPAAADTPASSRTSPCAVLPASPPSALLATSGTLNASLSYRHTPPSLQK